jgi:Xaa-Pro aminopeptidase
LTELAQRLRAVRARMRQEKLDALLVLDPADLRYMTGYRGEGAGAFITARSAWVLATHRNVRRAAKQTAGFGIVDLKQRPRFLKNWAKRRGGAAVGLAGSLAYGAFVQRRKALRPARVRASNAIRQCRAIKSPQEIALLRKAQREAEKVFARLLGELRPGLTEHQVHNRIRQLTLESTRLDGPAFPPICASGPSAWGTHSYYTERKIARNDCIILDIGVRYRGYCSDMTRTVFTGRPTRRMREVYGVVLEAQQRAIDAIRAGVPACDVYAAAREHIDAHGHGGLFDHGLGHGVGLEVHDSPVPCLTRTNRRPLREGMVLTVEPGIYLEKRFGVRIEDTVVVTADGCENLMRADKSLTVVG